MSQRRSDAAILDGIFGLLCDEIDAKSDDQLLADIREEGKDPSAIAAEIRKALAERVRRNRAADVKGMQLSEARLALTSRPPIVESPPPLEYRASQRAVRKTKPASGIYESSFVQWTNDSVVKFAGGIDPIRRMSERAEELVIEAVERGWKGPPYDRFKLAELLGIKVIPRADIADARTVDGGDGKALIEFNPQMPASRIRFSIAHELAHTFFPDCLERARYRARRMTWHDDDWQLELLCNVGAAEILIPAGSFSSLRDEGFDIVRLMEVRKELGVSTEAILLRVTKLARVPLACFD